MKYCRNCGVEINSEGELCPNCESSLAIQTPKRTWSIMSIIMFGVSIVVLFINVVFTIWNFTIDDLGFLFIWIISIAGCLPASLVSFVLSIVALCISAKRGKRGKGFAIAGLAMSSLALCLSVVIFVYPFILQQLSY